MKINSWIKVQSFQAPELPQNLLVNLVKIPLQMVHSIKIKFKWDVKEVEQVATTISLNSKTVISFIQALETKEVKFQHKHQVRKQFIKQTLLINMVVDVT